MAQVVDRWHKARPAPGDAQCSEHPNRVPAAGHGQGKRWQVRYRDMSGKQRKENFPTRPQADRRAAEIATDIARGQFQDPDDRKITFREYAEQWRKVQPHRPNTVRRHETVLRNHAYPAFGDRRMVSIRSSDIQAWATRLVRVDGLSEQSALSTFQSVSAVFNASVRDGILLRSPCAGVRTAPLPLHEVTPLTAEQVHRLADAVPRRYRALLILAAGSGLRPGELFGLAPGDVDYTGWTIKVDRQCQNGRTVPLKTRNSYRTVPVPQIVIDELRKHTEEFAHSEFVFTHDDGHSIRQQQFSQIWRDAVKAIGLPKGTRLHALRHTYASVLIAHGRGPKTVAARLGDTVAVAMRVYAHLFPAEDADTRSAVEDFLSAPDVPSGHVDREIPGTG